MAFLPANRRVSSPATTLDISKAAVAKLNPAYTTENARAAPVSAPEGAVMGLPTSVTASGAGSARAETPVAGLLAPSPLRNPVGISMPSAGLGATLGRTAPLPGMPGGPPKATPQDDYADINKLFDEQKAATEATVAGAKTEAQAAADKATADLAAQQAAAEGKIGALSAANQASTAAAGQQLQDELAALVAASQSNMSGLLQGQQQQLDDKTKASKEAMSALFDDMLSTNDQMREQMMAQGQLQLGNFLRRNSSLAAQAGGGFGSAFLSGQRQALGAGLNAMNQAQLQAMQQRMGVMGQRAGALGGLESQGLSLFGGLQGQGLGLQGGLLGQGLGMQGSGAGNAFGANTAALGQGFGAQAGLAGQGFGAQAGLGRHTLSNLSNLINMGAGSTINQAEQRTGAIMDERGAIRDATAQDAANKAEEAQKQRDATANDLLKQFFGPTANLENLQGNQTENLTEAQQNIMKMIQEYAATGDPELLRQLQAIGVDGNVTYYPGGASVTRG